MNGIALATSNPTTTEDIVMNRNELSFISAARVGRRGFRLAAPRVAPWVLGSLVVAGCSAKPDDAATDGGSAIGPFDAGPESSSADAASNGMTAIEGGYDGSTPNSADAGGSDAADASTGASDSGEPTFTKGVVRHLGDLAGATEDNQGVVVLPKSTFSPATRILKMAVAPDGSIATLGSQAGKVARFDKSFALVWRVGAPPPGSSPEAQIVSFPLNDVAFLANGNIAVTGTIVNDALQGETFSGQNDVIVGAFSPTGTQVWMHQWGTSNSDQGLVLVPLSDGSVLEAGTCFGQAPGNPPASTGGITFAKYSSDGTRTTIKQSSPIPNDSDQVHQAKSTSAGDVIALTFLSASSYELNRIGKFDTTGNHVWSTYIEYKNDRYQAIGPDGGDQVADDGTTLPRTFDYLALSTDGKRAYVASSTMLSNNAEVPSSIALSAFDAEGNYLWFRNAGVRSATIDPVEQVLWTGRFQQVVGIAASSDSVYIVGQYGNTYVNGSVARQPTSAAFIARYDLQGQQVWFKELGSDSGDVSVTAVSVGIDNNPFVAVSGLGGYRFVRLQASDGVVMN